MKTITIKKFGVMSFAKVSAALYAFMGFIAGAIMTLISLAASGSAGVGALGAMFGVGAIILLPIFYGIMGFIGGLLLGWAFNVVAPRVGGLSIEVEESASVPMP